MATKSAAESALSLVSILASITMDQDTPAWRSRLDKAIQIAYHEGATAEQIDEAKSETPQYDVRSAAATTRDHYESLHGDETVRKADLMVWIFDHHDHIVNGEGQEMAIVPSKALYDWLVAN